MEDIIKFKVPLHLCDPSKRIRFDGLLKILIEASVLNAEKVESGEKDYYWIIYRWYLKFYKEIFWKDVIEVKTASRKIKGFYAFRNFTVYKNGEKVVEADTKWLLINAQTRSLMKIPKDVAESYGETEGFEYKGKKIKSLESYENKIDLKIRKSDIDINGHVNNAVYLDYAIEGLEESNKDKGDLQIIYKKEVKYGEKLTLNYTMDNSDYYFMITSGDEEKTIGHIKFE